MHLFIYLQAEGDGFNITCSHMPLTSQDAREAHSVIEQMFSADGREAVLQALHAFRKAARNTGISDNYWSSTRYILQTDKEDIEVTLLHENAYAYRGHAAHPGNLHNDPIEKMIAFVDGSKRELAPECNIF